MVIVDDHLALLVLAGAMQGDELDELGAPVVTTSLWYQRLVAAITAPPSGVRGPGALARLLDEAENEAGGGEADDLRDRILAPPQSVLEVLHPMHFARETAALARTHRLNLLTAETLGAAGHHGASITIARPNAGGPLEAAAQTLGITVRVIEGP